MFIHRLPSHRAAKLKFAMLITDLLLAIPKNGPYSPVLQNSAGVFNFLLDYTALDSFAASGCLCKGY